MWSENELFYGSLSGVALVIYAVYKIYLRAMRGRVVKKPQDEHQQQNMKSDQKEASDSFKITPLPNFNWRTTEPLQLRPFKPKYHLTMAVENTTLSELLEFDKNYLDRITLRKQIIRDHHSIAIQADLSCTPAINELYTFLTSNYLPTRFPTIFTLTSTSLFNTVTTSHLPLIPPTDPVQTFELLGENIDDDFLILLPSEDGDGYKLMGYVTCFPAGFNTKEKFGMKLRDIHGPVPGYKMKLEKSMDRFFERLEVGKVVKRANWAINTTLQLFAASGTHLYEGEVPVEEDVNIETTYLRCERQLLHRLPETKALCFSFKTYLYPLKDVKEEGSGKELADAVEGLRQGSVPEIFFYKRGVVWGEKVKEYLGS